MMDRVGKRVFWVGVVCLVLWVGVLAWASGVDDRTAGAGILVFGNVILAGMVGSFVWIWRRS